MKIDNVLIKPVLTEKATNQTKNNIYTFEVNPKVNKFQIKETLEKLYKIKIGEIKITNRKGKVKKVGRKMIPKISTTRKIVFVKLTEGKIDLFPQA